MTSRPMTRANIIDQVNNVIGSSLTTTWTDAKINQLLDDTLTEISGYVPYITRDIYQIESRTGTATSTSANNLVDATNAQFISLAADGGKVVYNTTDKTWATIETYSSTSQVGLSKDIFTSGENYEIYNKGCWSNRQINVADSSDYLWIIGAVYPIYPEYRSMLNMRNVILHSKDIIELDVNSVDDSATSNANKDVYVYFARQHYLSGLTDLAGVVTGAHASGVSSVTIGSLGSTELIPKDTLITFATATSISSRLTYRTLADVTTSANSGVFSIFPSLETDLPASAVATFIPSTLTPDLELIIVQIVSGEVLMAEGVSKINAFAIGGTAVSTKSYEIGERMAEKGRRKLKNLVDVELRANHIYSRS